MGIHKSGAGKVISVYDLGTDSFFNPGVMMTVPTDVSLKQAGGSQSGFQVGRMGPYRTTI